MVGVWRVGENEPIKIYIADADAPEEGTNNGAKMAPVADTTTDVAFIAERRDGDAQFIVAEQNKVPLVHQK